MHDISSSTPLRPVYPLPWLLLGAVLLTWGAGVLTLAEADSFKQAPEQSPWRLMAGLVVPVIVGVLVWRLVPAVRRWTDSWDLATVVAMQTFRVLGILFLFFWWIGTLPTVFAWVAALGDVAVGVMAIPATIAVARQTPGWQAKVRWLTVAGLADFAILLVIAVLSQEGRILHFLGDPVAMEAMPLIMIPAFLVPNFILLLLLQWQRARS